MRISDWSSDVCSSDLPVAPVDTTGTLALAAANADFSIAEASVRLARANRVPDLNVGPAIRRLEATNDMAAVFTVSIPIPVFNNGRAAIAQATAQRTPADAQRRSDEHTSELQSPMRNT